MADVGVELLQRRPARDHEILLHGDIEVGALEIRGQEVAVGNELAADRGQKQFLIACSSLPSILHGDPDQPPPYEGEARRGLKVFTMWAYIVRNIAPFGTEDCLPESLEKSIFEGA